MEPIDKRSVLVALKKALEEELERFTRRALDAAEAATHEENKPEGDKDMRSTEASYIARGQAERAKEIEAALLRLANMDLVSFKDGDTVGLSALVDLKPGVCTYFVVPVGGGTKLTVEGKAVQSLAITSPLGAALVGLTEGDDVEVKTPQGMRTYEVVKVR